jgi:nucleotide-binding universal stress UspA family protein
MADQIADQTRRIVVGVDTSPCSKAALSWAMTQARETGAVVEAVTAWQDSAMYGSGIGYAYMPSTSREGSVPKAAQRALEEAIAEVSAQMEHPVKVLTRVVQGHPAEMLLTASAGAEMLVVGTRGHGTLAGMLLGSVSQHCVQHAPCPVVIVPLATSHAS